MVDKWIKEDTIAKHALYLRATVELYEGARFLVAGNELEFHDHLAITTRFGGLACEWLIKYLGDPNTANPKPEAVPTVIVGSGKLFVNPGAFTEMSWERYVPSEKVPQGSKLSNAIRNMSTGQRTFVTNGKRLTYFEIKTAIVLSQASRLLLGDFDAISARINKPNALIDSVLTAESRSSNEVLA